MTNLNVVVEVGDIDVEIADTPEIDVVVEEQVVAAFLVAGPAGPAGPAGDAGFEHVQSAPAATWSITHGMGRYPLGSQVTVDGEVVHADIVYPNSTTVVVTFASPQAGVLRLI